MASNPNTDVDKLISYGQMALEQGWYDKAREYFQQALDLAPSSREAMKGLARVNEILSRSRPMPVKPTRAEPVEPLSKVSLEPIKPEPAKPRRTDEPTTTRKGKRRWLVLAVIPVVLLAVVFAYQRVLPALLPIPTPTSTPRPIPTPTQTLAEYCRGVISYEKAAESLMQEMNSIPLEGDTLFIVQKRQQMLQKWLDLSVPDIAKQFHDNMVLVNQHMLHTVNAVIDGNRTLVTYHSQQVQYYLDRAADSKYDLLYTTVKCESYLDQQ